MHVASSTFASERRTQCDLSADASSMPLFTVHTCNMQKGGGAADTERHLLLLRGLFPCSIDSQKMPVAVSSLRLLSVLSPSRSFSTRPSTVSLCLSLPTSPPRLSVYAAVFGYRPFLFSLLLRSKPARRRETEPRVWHAASGEREMQ